jgi:hypothetical protein
MKSNMDIFLLFSNLEEGGIKGTENAFLVLFRLLIMRDLFEPLTDDCVKI